MTLRQLALIFTIILGLTNLRSDSSSAQTPPPPPRTPPPNQTEPGGGLNPLNSSCESKNKSVKALVPAKNPVLTTNEHPTFLFYVPFESQEIRYGEFSLLVWPQEKTRIFKTRFTLPQTPGVVSITLPSLPDYALEEGQFYHWYFKLYCQSKSSTQTDLALNGWIQRVPLTPEREAQINSGTPDVWYDSLAKIAEELLASPQDATLRDDWVNLLQVIDSEDLAEEPLTGSVIFLED
ncbi:MAG: DUF928 domain-containing protein [Symploca sp. SIO1C2]|nr:DUF928 domain-containing protein [Symploca sp. SIO1C2]